MGSAFTLNPSNRTTVTACSGVFGGKPIRQSLLLCLGPWGQERCRNPGSCWRKTSGGSELPTGHWRQIKGRLWGLCKTITSESAGIPCWPCAPFVVQDDLELQLPLPPLPMYCNCRHAACNMQHTALHRGYVVLGIKPRALHKL